MQQNQLCYNIDDFNLPTFQMHLYIEYILYIPVNTKHSWFCCIIFFRIYEIDVIDIVSQVYIIKDTKLKGNYRICLATVYLRIKQQYGEKRSTVGTNKNVNCLLINTSRSNLRQLRLFKWTGFSWWMVAVNKEASEPRATIAKSWSCHFESITVVIMTWLTTMKHLCDRWTRICSVIYF
jgi:hypothetical protein